MMNDQDIGRRLEAAVKQKDLNLTELAKSLGIARQTLYNLFEGSGLTRERIEAIAKATGANIYWLITGENPPVKGDRDLLISVVEGLETALKSKRLNLSPQPKGRAVASLYFQALDAGRLDPRTITELVEIISSSDTK